MQNNTQEPDMQGEGSPCALPIAPVTAPAEPLPVSAPASAPAQPAMPAQTPAKPAQPLVKPAPHSAPAALTPSKMPDAQQLLDRLKEDILTKGDIPSLFHLNTLEGSIAPLLKLQVDTSCSNRQLCKRAD